MNGLRPSPGKHHLTRLIKISAAAFAIALGWSALAKASPLGTREQRAKEALALRLLASPSMQEEIRRTEKLFSNDRIVATPSGQVTLHRAVASTAMAAALYAANEDADRPAVIWATCAPHNWHGMKVPRSGYAIDNPDNVYRMTPLDGAARYEIRGKINPAAPAQQTFVLYSSIPGITETMNSQGHMVELGSLLSSDLVIGRDGRFVITVDGDPAQGRPNHLVSDPHNHDMHLLIRDTLADWSTQKPTDLEVRRLGGPPLRPKHEEVALAQRAAELLSHMGPYWLNWTNQRVLSQPANEISAPWARATGWGFSSFGNFSLGQDETWVVTLSSLGAAYLGFQVADPWGIAVEYVDRNGSLNQSQAKPNADGSYTYVISPHDPGVYNWIDTTGLTSGIFTLRWQDLPKSVVSAADGVRSSAVVKTGQLRSVLPAGTVFVTPEARKAQLVERAASYGRRLAN